MSHSKNQTIQPPVIWWQWMATCNGVGRKELWPELTYLPWKDWGIQWKIRRNSGNSNRLDTEHKRQALPLEPACSELLRQQNSVWFPFFFQLVNRSVKFYSLLSDFSHRNSFPFFLKRIFTFQVCYFPANISTKKRYSLWPTSVFCTVKLRVGGAYVKKSCSQTRTAWPGNKLVFSLQLWGV
jgi:hypothetical protein